MAAAVAPTTATALSTFRNIAPPSSPFAALLRRSRFASYDPAIGQTYSSPSAHVSRGNWGLKRPLNVRKRGTFITLKSFEDHAQYIEWNNAETEVRFLRRVEEMNTTPAVAYLSPWSEALGEAKVDWLIDSEFCPANKEKPESISTMDINVTLDGLGTRGKGQYGARRPPTQTRKLHIQPNIDAMLPRQFERYVKKLRSLRPQFKAHLDVHAAVADPLNPPHESLYEIAQNPGTNFHRTFLAEHTASEFASPPTHPKQPRIAPQPHRTGALLYARPSVVDSYFSTSLQPGLALNTIAHANLLGRYARGVTSTDPTAVQPRNYRNDQFDDMVVSFGGLAAGVEREPYSTRRMHKQSVTPLFDPTSTKGVDPAAVHNATRMMRLKANEGLVLVQPPNVVGRWWGGIKDVKIHATVDSERADGRHVRQNPFYPGTMEYSRSSSAAPKMLSYHSAHRASAPVLRKVHLPGLDKVGETGVKASSGTLGLLSQFQSGRSAFGSRARGRKDDKQ